MATNDMRARDYDKMHQQFPGTHQNDPPSILVVLNSPQHHKTDSFEKERSAMYWKLANQVIMQFEV